MNALDATASQAIGEPGQKQPETTFIRITKDVLEHRMISFTSEYKIGENACPS